MIMWRYYLTLTLLSLPIVLYTAWQAVRHKSIAYFMQRMGLMVNLQYRENTVCIHAASVGEVNAVMPLIELMDQQCPPVNIVLTTNTPTGAAIATKKLPARFSCHLLPVDWKWAINRFMKKVQPCHVLVMETELWPNLYRICHDRNTPVVIINGRISNRTLDNNWLKPVYRETLLYTRSILTRSEQDQASFIQLGAKADKTRVLGNIKFAAGVAKQSLQAELKRPYLLAASTREGEEKQLALIWKYQHTAKHLLVIAPRHPKRLKQILSDLKPLDMEIAIRSKHEPITSLTDIYIVDTLGELDRFIAHATLVFMGGSLVPRGGQNILEAARAGKAVIFGPHMDNFADEAALLIQRGAALQASDAKQLDSIIALLLGAPDKLAKMAASGKQTMSEHADIHRHYLRAIIKLCPGMEHICQSE